MDFFASQDIARRNTKFLLFLFMLAVISLVIMTNVLVFVFINVQDTTVLVRDTYYFDWETSAAISLGVVTLIALASLFRMHLLKRGGGSAVAELMDGELLVDHGGNFHKRKLLNVVQEMAIASGTPVPPVYLIDSPAINAFAAGYSPGDAVIGMTTGAMESLTRDELQGVVAHEFSHILNGDMRLNIRLMGVLYGILILALLGRILLQPTARTSRDRSSGGIIALGAGLMAIGYLGQFFGNLIKAAVSRQREYLADSSAVQFTRNPQGISDALKRIGGFSVGSVIEHPESAELSHAFFSQGITFSLASVMATHPPLPERIRRIDPAWDGKFVETTGPAPEPVVADETATDDDRAATVMGLASGVTIHAADVVTQVGNPQPAQVDIARQILSSLPEVFTDAASTPYAARALVYLLLLDGGDELQSEQVEHLRAKADFGVHDEVMRLRESMELLAPEMRLPLLELSYPALRQLSYEQYKLFLSNIDAIIRADGKVSLSEWALQKMLRKHLGEVFESEHSEVKHQGLASVASECAVLLSLLAYSDREATVSPEEAFSLGAEELDLSIELLDKSELGFTRLNAALDELAKLHPLRKPKLLKACVQAVTADSKVAIVEAELLRTVADILECPMPPLMPDARAF